MSKLSERLKEYMEERDINQCNLAKATNIVRSNISEFLCEKHTPSYKNFVALLDFFNCSADYLLGLVDYPTEEPLHPVAPFGERLRFIMKTQKVKQKDLIENLPVSSSVLYKWLAGKSQPSTETLVRLANYFECSVDFLIGRIK